MSKLSKQQKLDLYRKWKTEDYSFNELSSQENLSCSTLKYLLKLIDKYGGGILDQQINQIKNIQKNLKKRPLPEY